MTVNESSTFQNVQEFTPVLQDNDNNETFPAITVVFSIPTNSTQTDPWEYINDQYRFEFGNQDGLFIGKPCNEIETINKSILEAASLNPNTTGGNFGSKGIFTSYWISYCSPKVSFGI